MGREWERKKEVEILAKRIELPVLRDNEMGRRKRPMPPYRDLRVMAH